MDPGAWALWPWRLRAACREIDSAVFFSPDGERGPAREVREARAKAICARCPVIGECATYALVAGERHGVWAACPSRTGRRCGWEPSRTGQPAGGGGVRREEGSASEGSIQGSTTPCRDLQLVPPTASTPPAGS